MALARYYRYFNGIKFKCQTQLLDSKKRSFLKQDSGAAALEFAFIALPFMLILVFTLEIGITYFASKILQIHTDRVAREVQVGNFRGEISRDTIINFLYPTDEVTTMNIFDKDKLLIEVVEIGQWESRPSPERDPITGEFIQPNSSLTPGEALSINIVNISYRWPSIIDYSKITQYNISTLWQNGGRTLTGRAAFQIEPYK